MLLGILPRSILAGFLLLTLAACGGSSVRDLIEDKIEREIEEEVTGDDDGMTGGGEPWPVSAMSVQDLAGAQPLHLDADQVASALTARTDAADSLLASDVLVKGLPLRAPATCGASASDTCRLDLTGLVPLAELAGVAIEDPNPTISAGDLDYEDGDPDTGYQAIATYRGVSLGQGRGSSELVGLHFDRYGYGGWLDSSYFVVESAAIGGDTPLGNIGVGYSVGAEAGSNPTGTGRVTWTGVMVGTDVSATSALNNRAQGDAEITIEDLADPQVDVSFANITDLATGDSHDDLSWSGIPLMEGRFTSGSAGASIDGKFYGSDHAEVGGVFERNDVVGAFGATRD